jgi:lysophospholipase L1-like esterase
MPPSAERINRSLILLVLALAVIIVYVTWRALDYRDHVNVFLEKYTKVVNEFSQRSVFAEANRPLLSDTLVPRRVVLFGTQVARNWDLAASLPDWEIINRGIAGQRLSGMLLRFRPDVIALKPQAVVIEISSYNFREESSISELEDYAAAMAELARSHDITPILTTLIPHRESYHVYESEYQVIDSIAVYNRWVRDYCNRTAVPLVDCNGLLADPRGYLREELSANAVEPNEKGYAVLTTALREALVKVAR